MQPHQNPQDYQHAGQGQQTVVREASTYMTDPEAQKFCEIFAEGIDSGLGYARILNFLERKGVRGDVVRKLRTALLEEGMELSAAFARFGLLDPAARKLTLVAERQGTLPQMFRGQIPIYRNRHERKKHLLNGLFEPMFMSYLAFFVMVPFVLNIKEVYDHDGGLLSGFLAVALAPMIIGLFFVFGALLAGYGWLSLPVDSNMRDAAGQMWMRIPGVSRPGRLYATALFCRYFASSVSGGLNIYDSIYLAAEASNDPRLMDHIDLVHDALDKGYSLQDALSYMKALPDDALDYIGLGEETGRLGELIDKCAKYYETASVEAFDKQLKVTIYILRFLIIIVVFLAAVLGLMSSMGEEFRRAFDEASMLAALPVFIWLHATIKRGWRR